MTPELIKSIVDAVFTELETLTANRPIVHLSVHLVHGIVDQLDLTAVAAKIDPPAA